MIEREQLEQSIAAMQAQRATLGDAVVDATIAALRKQLAEQTAAHREIVSETKRRKVTGETL